MRQPSVFVRDLRPDEGRKLQQISRKSKQFARRQRAAILLASAAGMSAPHIAEMVRTDENQVRRVIKEFNEEGFDSLNPRVGGGRPRRIDEAARKLIASIALACPREHGVPINRWSLRRLRDHLIKKKVMDTISVEHLRRILRDAGVTHQRTRTWKQSNDPDYEAKAKRPHGVSYLFGAYDVGSDRLWGRIKLGKSAADVLRYLKTIRARYPENIRIYLVLDNLSTHCTPDIKRWAWSNRVSLVYPPTYASYFNRIECQFWSYKEFVINGSDYQSHEALQEATRQYIRYRNGIRTGTRYRELENRRKVA